MKKSINRQVFIIFEVILASAIVLCMLANLFFLKTFYSGYRRLRMEYAFKSINEASTNNSLGSEDFLNTIRLTCERHNLSILIMNDNQEVIASIQSDSAFMKERFVRYFVNGVIERRNQLFTSDNYIFINGTDPDTGTKYMEIWGQLDSGEHILLTTPIEGIENNAMISNIFLIIIGFLALGAGSFFVLYMSKIVTRPITQISEISKHMTNLEFDIKYSPSGADNEIDQLGENMNKMSDTLEKTISELKTVNNHLQNELDSIEEMEDMRREFVSNVSHELKTPLALIQGYAEGLKDGITDDPENMEYYCDVIIDEADKLNKMVKKLLNLNELEFGAAQFSVERFNIHEVISNILDSMDIIFKQKEITVKYENTDNIYVWSDEIHVEEVFKNYLTNAINHCKYAKEIVISIDEMDDLIRVKVFNTGDNIPGENIEHIWEKFYKVDKARTREYGGNGVGLSIVKAVMESLGQDYGVENTDGGVMFYFDLPLK